MAKTKGHSKLWAFIAYLLSIIGILLAWIVRPKDRFVMYHVKQSFGLLIFSILVSASAIIPIIGAFVAWLGGILVLIFWIQGMIHALVGLKRPLWLIGPFIDQF